MAAFIDFRRWARNGIDATQACCACGGGYQKACSDYPNGWRSSTHASCKDYADRKWCTKSGGYGTGWDFNQFVNFAKWAVNGIDASQACCECGGGQEPTPAPTPPPTPAPAPARAPPPPPPLPPLPPAPAPAQIPTS